MYQLLKPGEFVEKLLPKQIYDENCQYRFSYFTLIIDKGIDVLIYNNLTREYLILTNLEYDQLRASNFTLPIDIIYTLVEKWFLVKNDNDDLLLCRQVINLVDVFISNKTKCVDSFNILPTTACNARCFYCFQAGTEIKTMDINTATDVADYIIKKSGSETAQIAWFGGEPLCNIKAINRICQHLNCNNKKFYSTITTNGYLFDEQIIELAKKEWHLRKAQITLDGLSDTYLNVKRYTNNDSNAFYRVLDNIDLLLKNEIRVEIRLNFDNHNYDELSSLISLLSKRFDKYDNVLVYVRPLYENVGYKQIRHDEASRNEIFRKYKQLEDQIKNKKMDGNINLSRDYRTRACQADDERWRLILPDGKLAFCEHFLDNDSYGSIYDEVSKPTNWSEHCVPEEKCKTCPAFVDCLRNKKCPECQHPCYDYEQHMRIKQIYCGMETEYLKFIKNKAKAQNLPEKNATNSINP